jgi:hypothetical protein
MSFDLPEWYIDAINKELSPRKVKQLMEEYEKSLNEKNSHISMYGVLLEDISKEIKDHDLNKQLSTASSVYLSALSDLRRSDKYIFELKNNKEVLRSKSSGTVIKQSVGIENAAVIQNIIETISTEDCIDFINYLSKYPMLGYKNEIGKKIFDAIKAKGSIEIKEIKLFRIRKPYNISRAYVEEEMYKGPFLKTDVGRFSNHGINYVYFSENLEMAKSEACISGESKYTYIEVVLSSPKNVFDISNIGIPLFSHCYKKKDEIKDKMIINYMIPNYIANCCNELHFDGIKYLSTRDLSINNYVFFDVSSRDFGLKRIRGVNY